tara:strand:- start:1319 stop:1882 length:564 start_codon:yes stop_codon:yes gene_type:complete
MRIGIDCDGVLRDFIPDVINKINQTHPQHSNKILTPESWDWEDWLPFWTDDETEKYIFEDNYYDLFGPDANPIPSSLEDWPKLKEWAKENNHELILVSAQRPHCEEPTREFLEKYGFDFDEIHFTKMKQLVDVDVLVDDSPEKLDIFKERSINYGNPICFKQTWNTESQKKYTTIDRLSDIIGRLFG